MVAYTLAVPFLLHSSYALLIAERARKDGISLETPALRVGLFGAEPWSERTCRPFWRRSSLTAMHKRRISSCEPG